MNEMRYIFMGLFSLVEANSRILYPVHEIAHYPLDRPLCKVLIVHMIASSTSVRNMWAPNVNQTRCQWNIGWLSMHTHYNVLDQM